MLSITSNWFPIRNIQEQEVIIPLIYPWIMLIGYVVDTFSAYFHCFRKAVYFPLTSASKLCVGNGSTGFCAAKCTDLYYKSHVIHVHERILTMTSKLG